MRPGRRLGALAALIPAWGVVVLTGGVGTVWAQTTEAPGPSAASPAPAVTAPGQPAPSETPPSDPGHGGGGGKNLCDNKLIQWGCAAGDVAKKLMQGDLAGAAGTAVSSVAAPVASAAVQAVQEGFAESISHWVA